MTDVRAACDRAVQAHAPALASASTLIGGLLNVTEEIGAATLLLSTERMVGSSEGMRRQVAAINALLDQARQHTASIEALLGRHEQMKELKS
jgi:hypothetical protein